MKTEKTQEVKNMFESLKKKDNTIETSMTDINKKPARMSIFERVRKQAMEEKMAKMEHQIKYKQKTIAELHDYIENHETLANDKLIFNLVFHFSHFFFHCLLPN